MCFTTSPALLYILFCSGLQTLNSKQMNSITCWVQNMHMKLLFTIKRWIKVVSLFGQKDGLVSECGNVMFSGTSVWIFLHSSGHRWVAKGSDMLQPVTFPQDASQQVWLSLPELRERNFNVLIIADKEKTRSALKNTDTRQLHLSEQR